MTETLPDDYDAEDSWNDQHGLNCCGRCETLFSGNGGIIGPVYEPEGTRHETIYDTDPSNGPWFCQSCWKELAKNQRQEQNQSLGDFA